MIRNFIKDDIVVTIFSSPGIKWSRWTSLQSYWLMIGGARITSTSNCCKLFTNTENPHQEILDYLVANIWSRSIPHSEYGLCTYPERVHFPAHIRRSVLSCTNKKGYTVLSCTYQEASVSCPFPPHFRNFVMIFAYERRVYQCAKKTTRRTVKRDLF